MIAKFLVSLYLIPVFSFMVTAGIARNEVNSMDQPLFDTSATATSYDSAMSILEWSSAVRVCDSASVEGNVTYYEGRIAISFPFTDTGYFRSWFDPHMSLLREEWELSGLSMAAGQDTVSAWYVANGDTIRLTEEESGCLSNSDYILARGEPGIFEEEGLVLQYLGKSNVRGIECFVIQVSCGEHKDRNVYYMNTSTGSIAKKAEHTNLGTRETWYSEYIEWDCSAVPGVTEILDSEDDTPMIFITDSTATIEHIDVSFYAPRGVEGR